MAIDPKQAMENITLKASKKLDSWGRLELSVEVSSLQGTCSPMPFNP